MSVHSGTDKDATEAAVLAAASTGDHQAFRALTDRYTRELHVHCYRMLGSYHDAEDAVQETLLRAWRHLATFEGRSSFRAWLYRIATNVCLRQGRRRELDAPVIATDRAEGVARSGPSASNLSPYPDALLDQLEATVGNPAATYELRESVQLAFVTAMQSLPPRQRAVLLLRDVLGWPAAEVAELLDATTASVNSALNRARATIKLQRAAGRLRIGRAVATDEVAQSLVQRYLEAWNADDMTKLAGLLKSDVVMTMPLLPLRSTGREAVTELFANRMTGGARDQFRCIPTRANRQPALAVYRRDLDGATYRAQGIWVLSLDGDAIAEITVFRDPRLVPLFGLPTEWDNGGIGGNADTERHRAVQEGGGLRRRFYPFREMPLHD